MLSDCGGMIENVIADNFDSGLVWNHGYDMFFLIVRAISFLLDKDDNIINNNNNKRKSGDPWFSLDNNNNSNKLRIRSKLAKSTSTMDRTACFPQ